MEFNINMENKKVFIFSIVIFLLGVLNGLINIFAFKRVHMGGVIIGFIPISVLIIRNTIAQAENLKYYKVVTPKLVAVFIIVFVANFFVTDIMDKSGINSNLGNYEKYLKLDKYPNNKYINHFPEKIPTEAENSDVSEWTGVYDNILGFYLSYNLSSDGISNLEKEEQKIQCKEVIGSISELNKVKQESQIPEKVLEELGIKDNKEGNIKFKIYIIDSSDIENWNHGYSYGIGINYESNKILYFGESW
jgi:hypothetical protein